MPLTGSLRTLLVLNGSLFLFGSAAHANLIENGDFSGLTGFGSGYGYYAPVLGACDAQQRFTITTDPSLCSAQFATAPTPRCTPAGSACSAEQTGFASRPVCSAGGAPPATISPCAGLSGKLPEASQPYVRRMRVDVCQQFADCALLSCVPLGRARSPV